MKCCSECFLEHEVPEGMVVTNIFTSGPFDLTACEYCGEVKEYVTGVVMHEKGEDGDNNGSSK